MPYVDGTFGCPVEAGLQLINGKWKPRILFELFRETIRFNELHRRIPDVSRHVLTVQLRELEDGGVVKRTVYPSSPPKVEYALTDFGKSLAPVMDQLLAVGERFIDRRQGAECTSEQPE